MLRIELDEKVMEFETVGNLEIDKFFPIIRGHLPVWELMKQVPDLVQNVEIPADEIADGLAVDQKTWGVCKVLLANGLSFDKTREWFRDVNPAVAYPNTPQELSWMFQTILPNIDHEQAPDFLAAVLKVPLRAMLDEEENLLVLLSLNVAADTLVRIVLSKGQITKHFRTLLKHGANIDMIIKTVGYYPPFYKAYPISYLVGTANAIPLDISRYVFSIEDQCPDEEVGILEQLCNSGMRLSDFINQIVIKEKTNLHVVVDNAYYFKVMRRIDVKSILEDLRVFDDTVAESVLNDRLMILSNYSKLEKLGIVDKRVLRKWRRVIGSFQIEEVLNYRCHNYSLEAEKDAEKDRRGGGEKAETSTKESKTAEEGNAGKSKVVRTEAKKEVKKSRIMEPQMPARARQGGFKVLD